MRFLEGHERAKLGAGNYIFLLGNGIPCTGTFYKTIENFLHLDNEITSSAGPWIYISKIYNIPEGDFNFLHSNDLQSPPLQKLSTSI